MVTEGPSEEESSILEEHVAYLQELTDRGVLQLAGRTQNQDDSTFGIIIFSAESEDSARSIMNDDPAVKHGIMKAELFPYKISFWKK
jgi:uncharacterized protein YciI